MPQVGWAVPADRLQPACRRWRLASIIVIVPGRRAPVGALLGFGAGPLCTGAQCRGPRHSATAMRGAHPGASPSLGVHSRPRWGGLGGASEGGPAAKGPDHSRCGLGSPASCVGACPGPASSTRAPCAAGVGGRRWRSMWRWYRSLLGGTLRAHRRPQQPATSPGGPEWARGQQLGLAHVFAFEHSVLHNRCVGSSCTPAARALAAVSAVSGPPAVAACPPPVPQSARRCAAPRRIAHCWLPRLPESSFAAAAAGGGLHPRAQGSQPLACVRLQGPLHCTPQRRWETLKQRHPPCEPPSCARRQRGSSCELPRQAPHGQARHALLRLLAGGCRVGVAVDSLAPLPSERACVSKQRPRQFPWAGPSPAPPSLPALISGGASDAALPCTRRLWRLELPAVLFTQRLAGRRPAAGAPCYCSCGAEGQLWMGGRGASGSGEAGNCYRVQVVGYLWSLTVAGRLSTGSSCHGSVAVLAPEDWPPPPAPSQHRSAALRAPAVLQQPHVRKDTSYAATIHR